MTPSFPSSLPHPCTPGRTCSQTRLSSVGITMITINFDENRTSILDCKWKSAYNKHSQERMQISVVLILSIQDKEINVCHFAKYITQMVLTESNMKERFPAIKVVWWINPRSFTAGLVSATETILLSYKLNMISWYSFFKVMHEFTSFHCPLALLKTFIPF